VIAPDDERVRRDGGPGYADAVTFAWGDPGAELHGLARVGLADGRASALALLFAGGAPVAALARGELEVPADADFARLPLPGVTSTVETPLRAWSVRFDGEGAGFDLAFEALGAPAEIDAAEPVARLGGMAGYEQLCRVQGTATVGGREIPVHCLGQRSHLRGAPDWDRLGVTRTVSAWLDDGTAFALLAAGPAAERGHDEEACWAAVLDPAGSVHVSEPRVSTVYDGEGRQRRAGMELWIGEDDEVPRRAAGEAIAGSTLELGRLRLDAAVFTWRSQGRRGVGRYDILRPAEGRAA
jgi:hypothetical protein